MQAEDYYQLLGVNRHASKETLRHAFRARMLELHPDLHPDDALACDQTRHLVEAYQTLSDVKARRAYDTSLARQEIPDLDWSYAESSETASSGRQMIALLLLAATVVFLFWVVRSAMANRSPVYRFQLTELWTDSQPQRMALLVEPEIGQGLEWYHTVEYELRNSSPLVMHATTDVYARAIEAAEQRHDPAAARFYRSSLSEIRRAQMTVPIDSEADPGTNAGNAPDPGAKRPAESS